MHNNRDKNKINNNTVVYEKQLIAADKAIMRGDLDKALISAQKGFELGLTLGRNEAAGQYLFCLNELGRFDETLQAAERFFSNTKNDDEAALANMLCAMLAVGTVQAERGMKLLKKLDLASASGWRRRFSGFNYNPVQTSLVFNAALIFYHAGKKDEALRLVKDVMQHIIFFIDTETGGTRELSPEVAETISEFLHLIKESDELGLLEGEDVFQELAEITVNS